MCPFVDGKKQNMVPDNYRVWFCHKEMNLVICSPRMDRTDRHANKGNDPDTKINVLSSNLNMDAYRVNVVQVESRIVMSCG